MRFLMKTLSGLVWTEDLRHRNVCVLMKQISVDEA